MSVDEGPRKTLIGVQAVFCGAYLLVLLLLGVAVLQSGGLTFSPFANSSDVRDPREVLGLGIVDDIVLMPLTLLVVFGKASAAIAALAGMGMLIFSPGHRTRWLYIGTALTLACAAVQFTPFGARLITWMLD
ncbi:hypothetical protein [Allorhizocola rhizosphaerae]|uniref:hypothetical protein n=1 Tax=Allorhizocola rhizosphaerae TaxID=1872709 RepID=UPI000E3DDC68|nr:hypothetical protein [Allorhizocola rhizosphaerae]